MVAFFEPRHYHPVFASSDIVQSNLALSSTVTVTALSSPVNTVTTVTGPSETADGGDGKKDSDIRFIGSQCFADDELNANRPPNYQHHL